MPATTRAQVSRRLEADLLTSQVVDTTDWLSFTIASNPKTGNLDWRCEGCDIIISRASLPRLWKAFQAHLDESHGDEVIADQAMLCYKDAIAIARHSYSKGFKAGLTA